MSYAVYRVSYVGLPRDHHAIFIETHESGDGTGHIFQVTGNIQTGMTFEDKPAKQPESSASYAGKTKIGNITAANYPQQVKTICQSIPPPKKQFDGPKKIYPAEPIRRCQEWTDDAIGALTEAQVVVP